MTHISLFSGIGGLDLAAEWAGFETVLFCERDPYCQKVLAKHWPGVPIIDDIRNITEETIWKELARNAKQEKLPQGDPTASHVIQKECMNGERKIEKNTGRQQGRGAEEEKKKLLKGMAGNAPVAGNQDMSSCQSIISTITEMKKERYINHKSGKASSIEDSQKDTKYYATTATTQKPIMESAPTKEIKYEITVLSAGPPCQPASTAGKRRGKEDDRWLWPETFRVIELLRPIWCVLENVLGLLSVDGGMAFEDLLLKMEALGYETLPLVYPACGVGANHRRTRVFIVGHAISGGFGGQPWRGPEQELADGYSRVEAGDVADAAGTRFQNRAKKKMGEPKADPKPERQNWWSIEPDVGRVVTRISNWLDEFGGINGDKVLCEMREIDGTATLEEWKTGWNFSKAPLLLQSLLWRLAHGSKQGSHKDCIKEARAKGIPETTALRELWRDEKITTPSSESQRCLILSVEVLCQMCHTEADLRLGLWGKSAKESTDLEH